jgi:uncharacterized membrane protein YeaQ/YmgE (transglycosylase-associated protein family)
MMGLLAWIVFGALAGWIASMIAGTNQRQGCLTDIVVGVLGAAIGGWLLNTLTGVDNVIDFSLSSLLVAVLGAVILLVVLKVLRR